MRHCTIVILVQLKLHVHGFDPIQGWLHRAPLRLTIIDEEKQAAFVVDYMRSLMESCSIDQLKCEVVEGRVKFDREIIEMALRGNESAEAKKLKAFMKLQKL